MDSGSNIVDNSSSDDPDDELNDLTNRKRKVRTMVESESDDESVVTRRKKIVEDSHVPPNKKTVDDSADDFSDENFRRLRHRIRSDERGRRRDVRNRLRYTVEKMEKELRNKDREILNLTTKLQECLNHLTSSKADWALEIQKKEQEYANEIKKIEDYYKKTIVDLEKEHDERIKLYSVSNEDDSQLGELSDKIYNSETIEEIMVIRDLVRNHRFKDLNTKQLTTLQNLFVSMSHGIIPICQPQRWNMSTKQKDLANKLQVASHATVRKLLNDNKGDIIGLFHIIDNSLKLVRDSYNRLRR